MSQSEICIYIFLEQILFACSKSFTFFKNIAILTFFSVVGSRESCVPAVWLKPMHSYFRVINIYLVYLRLLNQEGILIISLLQQWGVISHARCCEEVIIVHYAAIWRNGWETKSLTFLGLKRSTKPFALGLQWTPVRTTYRETLVLVRIFLGLADLLKFLQEGIDDSSMRSQKNPAQCLKNYTTRLAQFRLFGTFGKYSVHFLFESRYIWHKTNKAFHKRNITSPTRWWSCKGLGLFLLQDLHDLPTLMKSWILLLTRRMSWFNPWITLLLCSSTMIWKLHLCRA